MIYFFRGNDTVFFKFVEDSLTLSGVHLFLFVLHFLGFRIQWIIIIRCAEIVIEMKKSPWIIIYWCCSMRMTQRIKAIYRTLTLYNLLFLRDSLESKWHDNFAKQHLKRYWDCWCMKERNMTRRWLMNKMLL